MDNLVAGLRSITGAQWEKGNVGGLLGLYPHNFLVRCLSSGDPPVVRSQGEPQNDLRGRVFARVNIRLATFARPINLTKDRFGKLPPPVRHPSAGKAASFWPNSVETDFGGQISCPVSLPPGTINK